MEKIHILLKKARSMMQKAISHISSDLLKIRAGKAMPNMLDNIMVSYYGNKTPMDQVASINTLDARTLVIKPWEKSMIPEIEKAIVNSHLGLNPQNDGETVRINIPPLTEERRKILVKQVKQEGEKGKINIRNIRKDINSELKSLQKEGVAKDDIKKAEHDVQSLTNSYGEKIDDLIVKKEKEITTI